MSANLWCSGSGLWYTSKFLLYIFSVPHPSVSPNLLHIVCTCLGLSEDVPSLTYVGKSLLGYGRVPLITWRDLQASSPSASKPYWPYINLPYNQMTYKPCLPLVRHDNGCPAQLNWRPILARPRLIARPWITANALTRVHFQCWSLTCNYFTCMPILAPRTWSAVSRSGLVGSDFWRSYKIYESVEDKEQFIFLEQQTDSYTVLRVHKLSS